MNSRTDSVASSSSVEASTGWTTRVVSALAVLLWSLVANVTFTVASSASVFTAISTSLPDVELGRLAWGDYDNDGDLDVAIAGYTGSAVITRIYRNDGGGTFTDIGVSLVGIFTGSVAWGDYDNDGDLDLGVAGATTWGSQTGSGNGITKIYRNDGSGVFTDIGASVDGIEWGQFAWGDYDNDGDLDIAIAGWNGSVRIAKIYRNNGGGGFSDIGAGLTGVTSDGSVAWGDYDSDGDLDLAIEGNYQNPGGYLTTIYRNDNGTFTDIGAGLLGLYSGRVVWGDYDSDGDLDLIITGNALGAQNGARTRLYRNDSGTFTEVSTAIQDVEFASQAWADYDNDGDLDLAIAGSYLHVLGPPNVNSYYTRVYRNDGGGSFVDIGAGLTDVSAGQVTWGDYDSDGDVDLLVTGSQHDGWGNTTIRSTKIYRNEGHGIILHQGWNIASTYIQPADPSLTTMLAHIRPRVVILKNNSGDVYWPEFGIDTIGNWDYGQGYEVYMTEQDTLVVNGSQVSPENTPLALRQGWNTVGYLRNSPFDASAALSSLGNSLVIAKSNYGEVLWPELGINTIGSMLPGQGYQMYLMQAATLTYPSNN